jgi:hypothetical protein
MKQYVPYKELHPNYKIIFDFNNDVGDNKDEMWHSSLSVDLLPRVKTCANYVMIPVSAYDGDKDIFRQRLLTAIRLAKDFMDAR